MLVLNKQSAARTAGSALAGILLSACDVLLTDAPRATDLFDAPVAGLTQSELAAFARGDAEFGRRFAPATGLGPIFNNVSCASCHSGDGRGRLENVLHRIGSSSDDFLRGIGGPQVQDKAVPGAAAERVPTGIAVSVRLPPPVFGVGLIEAIPDSVIVAGSDPEDRNGDGISGRVNWVSPASYASGTTTGGDAKQLGRFGRKAQISNLIEQTVEAYHQDMGITSDYRPTENPNPQSSIPVEAHDRAADPEISSATVQAVVHYLRGLAAPAAGGETPARLEGRVLFEQVRCSACHTPRLMTGRSVIAALSNQPVELYSDLLLHDLGDELADFRPDGEANGREWRTSPLWGLRLMRGFLNGEALLLHDGRARTVEEAIRFHGGEAKASRDAFIALTPARRAALLDFVESR